MQTIGVYLLFAAVVLRAAVVLSERSALPVVMVLLAGYGSLLFGQTWLMHREPARSLQSPKAQLAYLFLQSSLVLGALIVSSYEDFLAMLFVPLSLAAVSVFGRRAGYFMIAALSLAMTFTLLFSDVGWMFGLVMGMLYSGICFLFGGYAHQVQMAKTMYAQNERIFQELQIAHAQLQRYADQKANLAIEQERNRLAHELHDSVTQTVFSMNLAVQSAHLLLDREATRVSGQLIRVERLAASAQRELQTLVSQLKPDPMLGKSLTDALWQLAADLKVRHGLQVLLEIHGKATVSEAVAAGIYSIAHEALINVAKHSGVSDVVVRLNGNEGHSCLEIEDHGAGFDPDAVMEQTGHLGLAGMQEQAHEIGWDLSVVSQPGRGTRILATETPPRGPQ